VGDVHDLGMPRRVAADLLVSGIGECAPGIAADRVDDARDFAEKRFQPQKQPAPNVAFSIP
jgi:hypothetical protein